MAARWLFDFWPYTRKQAASFRSPIIFCFHLFQHEPGSTTGNCEPTTTISTSHHRISSRHPGMLGGISSSAGPHAGPNVQGACIPGDTIIKEEPEFYETHCHWNGCDRDLHTQEQLVKVLYKSYYPSIYNSFTSLWYLESPFVFIVKLSKTCF